MYSVYVVWKGVWHVCMYGACAMCVAHVLCVVYHAACVCMMCAMWYACSACVCCVSEMCGVGCASILYQKHVECMVYICGVICAVCVLYMCIYDVCVVRVCGMWVSVYVCVCGMPLCVVCVLCCCMCGM